MDKEFMTQMVYAMGGNLIYALGFNMIIVPMGLYSGGFMGISQLVEILFIHLGIQIPSTINLVSILYFLINIPLFYMGLKVLGKVFAIKSIFMVAVLSAFMLIVPVPSNPIIDDYLTACILGGIICGVGTGLVLRGRASGGGQDIIGLCCAKKFPGFSVGKANLVVNVFVYGICFLIFDIQIVMYSLIFAMVVSVAIDKVHIQNINTSVMIFTKRRGISKAIMEQTGRGVTNWEGEGAYTEEKSYILFIMISKYEIPQVKKIIKSIDPNAFVIFTDGCSVEGNFEKRL